MTKFLLFTTAALCAATALAGPAQPMLFKVRDGYLEVTPLTSRIIRVAFAKDKAFFTHGSLAVVLQTKEPPMIALDANPSSPLLKADPYGIKNGMTMVSDDLQIKVAPDTGTVTFCDKNGKPILAEAPGGRILEPATVQGESTFHVRQRWEPNGDESLYGLGENQLGLLDIKGYDLDRWQHNTSITIPFLVSSKGYGILWDNPSYLRFGDLRPFEPMPADVLFDQSGKPGALTATYFGDTKFQRPVGSRRETVIDFPPPEASRSAPRRPAFPGLPRGAFSVRWEGTLVAPASGDYQFQAFSHSGIKVWFGGRLLMDHWRQNWLPWYDQAKLYLLKGQRCAVRVEYQADQGQPLIQFNWKTPSADKDTSLWSEVGDGIDYYFVYGPSIDCVISGYRQLTGAAPMMPKWAFGLFQSRQRYETQKQSLDVVDGFRSRQIPFDVIVQDWFYWMANAWGSHEFDPARFPDPAGWIKAIHSKGAKLMISVWPKFYPGTANFEAMNKRGFLYQPNLREGLRDWTNHRYTFYDAFNPDARKLFWSQMSKALLSKGVDAWWMDASEPDLLPTPTLEGTKTHMNPTALGPASRVLNAYPLVNAQAIYEGQRKDAPDNRVFILTRSGYAGQQRYAAASWSGDITSTWTAMKKQIAAGLSFSISGVPYWTMDSGGFSVPARFSTRNPKPSDVDEWRELNARWFEFAAFVPLLRVHGEAPFREMWQFGGNASPSFRAQYSADALRYFMLPYIYSVAGDVTRNGGTIMRPLVMDFQNDRLARDITDQYMFGPSILVCPVTEYGAKQRMVYLPKNPGGWVRWPDGRRFSGGQSILARAPYDSIPLFVRAGGIVPCGRIGQRADGPGTGPIQFAIAPGADGHFTLYEDDGETYAYEKGAFSTIPITWNQAKQTLTIGARQGAYAGMPQSRTFSVHLLQSGPTNGQPVRYSGKAVSIRL